MSGTENENDSETDEVPFAVAGSNLHLWNLLQGRIVVATDDVLSEELRDGFNRIVSGLTYYKPYERKENEEEVKFPNAPSLYRSSLTGKLELIIKKDENEDDRKYTEYDFFIKIRKAVAQHFKLDISRAGELVVSYMMYEFKGAYISYEEIADTQFGFAKFLRAIKQYYQSERLCLLYSIQAILADIGNEEHQFFKIIEAFLSRMAFKKWTWGLLRSISVAESDREVVEILHCLQLLMYKVPNDSIPEFFAYLSKLGFKDIRKTEDMRKAEGAAMYSALTVSGITDCGSGMFPMDFRSLVKGFMNQNLKLLIQNPYNIGPVFVACEIFGKDDPEVCKELERHKGESTLVFTTMLLLLEQYEQNSFRDQHSLSLVLCRSLFEGIELLLTSYETTDFGTNVQAYQIFTTLLQHNSIAESFLCDRPHALTALYTDSTCNFPVEVYNTLYLWKCLCMSARSGDICNTVIKGISRLNCIAELLNDDTANYVRRLDEYKVANLKARSVYGVIIEEGAHGMMNEMYDVPVVSWELPPSSDISAFEILRTIIHPVAANLLKMRVDDAEDTEYRSFDYAPQELHWTVQFVIQCWKAAGDQVPELTQFLHPACMIMESMLAYKTSGEERIQLIQDLFALVGVVSAYSSEFALMKYIYKILPSGDQVGMVEEMILGRESIGITKCEITLAFLDLIASLTESEKCWNLVLLAEETASFESHLLQSIDFVAQNIVKNCAKWRTENEQVRCQMYLSCFKIFRNLYNLEGDKWFPLKKKYLESLICSRSFLLPVLGLKELLIQDAIIIPNDDTKLLPEVLIAALGLVHKLLCIDKTVSKLINDSLEGLLVRILGRLVRHRIDPRIPSMAMVVLTEIAENTSLSLLACFGNDEAAFKDVILQRLEFIGEDINMKVSALEFFTIISQTQVGILQCFFADGMLENCIIDLMHEQSEILAVACLRFFRSLFRQRLSLPRSRDDFWSKIFSPINKVKRGCKLEIITATAHILTFELFYSGTSDAKLIKELEKLLKKDTLSVVMDAALWGCPDSIVKCLTSLKHLFTLLLGRPDLAKLLSKESLIHVQELTLQRFWQTIPGKDFDKCSTLSELLVVLTTLDSATPAFLSSLVTNLTSTFDQYSVAVQLSLLCLMDKAFTNCKEPVDSGDVQSTFRIVKRVFDVTVRLLEADNARDVNPIVSISANLVATIVGTQHVDVWAAPLKTEMISCVLLHVATTATMKREVPDVVANCLSAVIAMAENPYGCTLISTSLVSKGLYPSLYKVLEIMNDEKWIHIFLLCVHLNTELLRNLKQDFVEECLSFWGLYSEFFQQRLAIMTELTEICVAIDDPDKGYLNMKGALLSTTFVLTDILTLVPYMEQWQNFQSEEVFKTMRLVYYVLQEVCGLLQQPFLLTSTIGGPRKPGSPDTRVLPRVAEMQTKLWDVAEICTCIFVQMKGKDDEFMERGIFISSIFQLGQLSVKAMNRIERKSQPPAPPSNLNRFTSIIEKVLLLIYSYVAPILGNPAVDEKFQQAVRRDMCNDVVSLIDGIRRTGCSRNEFVFHLCAKLDEIFR